MHFSKIKLGTHIWVPVTEIPVTDYRRRYTFRPRGSDDEIPLYAENGNWFGIPRHSHPIEEYSADSAVSGISDGHTTKGRMTSALMDEQKSVLAAFNQGINQKKIGFVVEAPPGWGKTVAGISMLLSVGTTALVVVPQEPLVDQWVKRIVEHTTLRLSDIGTVVGRKAQWRGKSIVVALVHSLRIGYLKDDFKRYFGQVWYDEVHSSVPPATFAPTAGMFPARIRGGLSATLDRYDRGEVVFNAHVGQVHLKGTSNERRMKPLVLVRRFVNHTAPLPPINNGNAKRGMLISTLSGDPDRNELIANDCVVLYKTGRKTVIISDRTQQLSLIRYLLETVHKIPTHDIGFFCRTVTSLAGDSKTISNSEIQRATKKKIILATYGMMKQGTDIPDLAGLIYATPQSDVRQTKGRIERMISGKMEPVIVDIYDVGYGETHGWFAKRNRLYRAEGLKIKFVEA